MHRRELNFKSFPGFRKEGEFLHKGKMMKIVEKDKIQRE
jgi:hypothetical protein